MSRYIGPIWKKSRALGFSLRGDNKEFKKRTSKPGQVGKNLYAKKKFSNYALQNKEKQKLRFLYGLREKQLYNLFSKLKKAKKNTEEEILLWLKSRLDNVVSYLSKTRRAARQMVNHGHVLVDGKKIDIPSYKLKVGSIITFSKKIIKNLQVKEKLEKNNSKFPDWIKVEEGKEEVKIIYTRLPNIHELIEKQIDVSLVIEWYNKKI